MSFNYSLNKEQNHRKVSGVAGVKIFVIFKSDSKPAVVKQYENTPEIAQLVKHDIYNECMWSELFVL